MVAPKAANEVEPGGGHGVPPAVSRCLPPPQDSIRVESYPDCRHVAAVIPRLTMGRFPSSTSFAALGTTICRVRGDSSDLFLCDAIKHDELSRKGPSMLEHKVCPLVVAIGSKLIVFGGYSTTSRRASLAEVYDMSTNEWTYLPPWPPHLTPPMGTSRKSFSVAAITVGGDESKQIIVGGWGQMFCTYQMSTQT
ncbi:hypothetical protein RHSIM_Rhsim04G0029600 [Rhododendron simsii]|uniref:Uncharacterized protein n=1 Tax=Rhododendron simsii TaxID=118357 RepID=A0A834H1Y3_RHOSS|nr:hypothetical protein RHSIM_Rhsim04G0029600 [Rhododendron simsii]